MIIDKTVKVKWNNRVRGYYESKGYKFTKTGDIFIIRTEDLTKGNGIKIHIRCDNCNKKRYIEWKSYLKCLKNNKYYCKKCASQLYGANHSRITKLKNSINFYDWCIKNDYQDLLDRWDYKLNKCSPKDISYSTDKFCWFKCPKNIHNSELKSISHFVNRRKKNMDCAQCNSFAQYLINLYGENALKLYWDYNKNTIDPWEINKCGCMKVWIKCQDINYHESYQVRCSDFTIKNSRCPYCTGKKVHKFDSLGWIYPQVLEIWSDKNKKSPYEYTPHSQQKVWWKCPDSKHKDYFRDINSSGKYNFRCPSCDFSKGEKRIEDWLNIHLITYESQKAFNNLIGLGNRNLTYDFYLPKQNLLIEYQGEFHKQNIVPNQTKEQFKYQQEHDRRKKQYTIDNNINFLEIWYWDFNNIESILEKEVNNNR